MNRLGGSLNGGGEQVGGGGAEGSPMVEVDSELRFLGKFPTRRFVCRELSVLVRTSLVRLFLSLSLFLRPSLKNKPSAWVFTVQESKEKGRRTV